MHGSFPAGQWIPPNGQNEKEMAATYILPRLACGKPCSATPMKRDGVPLWQWLRSAGRDVQYGAALALAYAGDDGRAQALTGDLDKRFPEDTIVQFNYLPTLRAKLALSRGNAPEAIENLRTATPYELGRRHPVLTVGRPCTPFLCAAKPIWPRIRAAKPPPSSRKSRPTGIVLNEPIGALAHLGLGRAYVLAGDTAKGAPPIRTSSPSGKTPTPTSPS
jgi:hypothetical protein